MWKTINFTSSFLTLIHLWIFIFSFSLSELLSFIFSRCSFAFHNKFNAISLFILHFLFCFCFIFLRWKCFASALSLCLYRFFFSFFRMFSISFHHNIITRKRNNCCFLTNPGRFYSLLSCAFLCWLLLTI